MASRRVPTLLGCGDLCSKLFLSCEPLLGSIQLHDTWAADHPYASADARGIDWVITGDESGPVPRRSEVVWHESIVRQCRNAGVAVFVKQLRFPGGLVTNVAAFPLSLQVQQFPC
jgi:protein gp37